MAGFIDNIKKERELKRLNAIADKIEELSKGLENISDNEIIDRTLSFKNRIKAGENVNDILPEAFALASEALYRKMGFKPYRVQLMGAISIFEGRGVEMRTGEGKTITGIFPAYLHALTGEPVHIMTSNDYLASRDAETVTPVFNALGLSVGSIDAHLSTEDKKKAYESDVIYGTTANFGFDFLRDNLAYKPEDKFMRKPGFAIVDEADSLLLDQARTPLILSETAEISQEEDALFKSAAAFARTLSQDDVDVDNERHIAVLTEAGVEKAEKYFGVKNYDELFVKYIYYINNAITATYAFEKDADYIVRDGKIVLIDKNTARPLPTHRFSEGLHQAIEAKENLQINPESKILGKITIQNYLKKYGKISGMSGTIKTSEEELRTIYGLDVVEIPTNKPVQRKDDTRVFQNIDQKLDAIVQDVYNSHLTGQPILLGTHSIEESEILRRKLAEVGIRCNVLNAKNLSQEAAIIANAGRLGSVTIATDMAGRGTDIKLGGDASVISKILAEAGINKTYAEIKQDTKENREKVIAAGGLKVIGASLHDLVRVDGQLRGRSGRQGDVGETVFYTCLDDPIFNNNPEVKKMLMPEIYEYMRTKDERIKDKILRVIEKLQEKNESIDFASRKAMLTYDREASSQYDEFYKLRNEVLASDDISVIFSNGADYLAERIIDCSLNASNDPEFKDDNYKRYKDIFERFDMGDAKFGNLKSSKREALIKKLSSQILSRFNSNMINGIGKTTLLKTMDGAFINHLNDIEMLKRNTAFEAYGDSDPLRTFETRAHEMYNEMIDNILPEVVMELIEKSPKKFEFKRFNIPSSAMQNQ